MIVQRIQTLPQRLEETLGPFRRHPETVTGQYTRRCRHIPGGQDDDGGAGDLGRRAGVDFIIGETFSYAEEALTGLELVKEAGLPAVITLAVHREPQTREGWSVAEACKRLEDSGADVLGLDCMRGPRTMLPLLEEIVPVVDVAVAALPVPYRIHRQRPTFQSLRDPCYEDLPSGLPFPTALDPFYCNRYEIADFAWEARDVGVGYFGLCCGAAPHYIRSMAETLGRTPPASRYSADMSKHVFFGAAPTLRRQNIEYRSKL